MESKEDGGAERISGEVVALEFLYDAIREEGDDRDSGTYVTILVREDHRWSPGDVVIERPARKEPSNG